MNISFHESKLLTEERKTLEEDIPYILRSGKLTGGEYTRKLEEEVRKISGMRHALAFSSGTAALYCAVRAVKALEQNMRMAVTTPLTWRATTNAIRIANMRCLYCDVDDRGIMNFDNISPHLWKNNSGRYFVLPVSLYGQKIDPKVFEMMKLAPWILDAAHSINQLDTIGRDGIYDIICFSLHPTKLFFAGEGGLAITNDEKLYDAMKALRWQGVFKERSLIMFHSLKFTMPEISAAIALRTLQDFDTRVRMLQLRIERYLRNFGVIKIHEEYFYNWGDDLKVVGDKNSSMMNILVNIDFRNKLLYRIKRMGCGADVKYLPLLEDNEQNNEKFPNLFNFTKRLITLPCYPTMELSDIDLIVDMIYQIYHEWKGKL